MAYLPPHFCWFCMLNVGEYTITWMVWTIFQTEKNDCYIYCNWTCLELPPTTQHIMSSNEKRIKEPHTLFSFHIAMTLLSGRGELSLVWGPTQNHTTWIRSCVLLMFLIQMTILMLMSIMTMTMMKMTTMTMMMMMMMMMTTMMMRMMTTTTTTTTTKTMMSKALQHSHGKGHQCYVNVSEWRIHKPCAAILTVAVSEGK